MKTLTNLQKAKLSQDEANIVYPKIEQAYNKGDFEEAIKLRNLYETLVNNAIMWTQKQVEESKRKHGLK